VEQISPCYIKFYVVLDIVM